MDTDEHTPSTQNTKEVMLEDGLEDVENLYTTKLNDYYYTARKKGHTNNYTEEHNTHNKKCTTRNNTHNINYIKEHNMHNNNC